MASITESGLASERSRGGEARIEPAPCGEDRAKPAQSPSGYPPEYQRTVTLRDGRRVFIRPILPSDAPELAEALETADPDTLRRRFLGRPPRATPALLTHLTTVDYVQRFALVAIDPATQRGVGIARYRHSGDGVAEIAVAVSPAWRRVGLGTVLIRLLARAAADRGISTFTARYLADNRPIATLLERIGGHRRHTADHGIAESRIAVRSACRARRRSPGTRRPRARRAKRRGRHGRARRRLGGAAMWPVHPAAAVRDHLP
jgi:RimJ/RimL family protein N-acetyltransferase